MSRCGSRDRTRRAANLPVRVSPAAHHGQPGPRRSAQGRWLLRSAHRPRHPRRVGQIPAEGLASYGLPGSSLTGELRPVRGALALARQAASSGRTLILPRPTPPKPPWCSVSLLLAASLLAVAATPAATPPRTYAGPPSRSRPTTRPVARREGSVPNPPGLEVAASGQHSLLLFGPPGTGKSMLAQRLPGLLPP